MNRCCEIRASQIRASQIRATRIPKAESIWAIHSWMMMEAYTAADCAAGLECSAALRAAALANSAAGRMSCGHHCRRAASRRAESRWGGAVPAEACWLSTHHCGCRHSRENAASRRGLHLYCAASGQGRGCWMAATRGLRLVRRRGTSPNFDFRCHGPGLSCCQCGERGPGHFSWGLRWPDRNAERFRPGQRQCGASQSCASRCGHFAIYPARNFRRCR
jgi:hypothetical protein